MKPLELKSKLQSGGKVYGTMIWALEGTRWSSSFSKSDLDYAPLKLFYVGDYLLICR